MKKSNVISITEDILTHFGLSVNCRHKVIANGIMDRNEFIARLKENGIPPEIVSFDSSTNDGYNIRKNKLRWETFIRERGEEYECIGFPSESDALQHMFDELIAIYA